MHQNVLLPSGQESPVGRTRVTGSLLLDFYHSLLNLILNFVLVFDVLFGLLINFILHHLVLALSIHILQVFVVVLRLVKVIDSGSDDSSLHEDILSLLRRSWSACKLI
jgi:hypothetical protein